MGGKVIVATELAQYLDLGIGWIPASGRITSRAIAPPECRSTLCHLVEEFPVRLKGFTLGFTASLLAVASAHAAAVQVPAGDYSVESWDERQGLPSGRIWAITQDAAGYLWLGMEAGLVRFDGVRFVRWTSDDGTLPENPDVSSLYSAADGSLWLGFYSGGVGRIREGRLERYGKSAGILGGRVLFVTEDRAGVIWAGDVDSLYRFQAGRWESGARSGLPAGGAFDAYEDRAGDFWIATSGGIFRRRAGQDTFEHVGDTTSPFRFSEDSTGRMWMTDERGGFAEMGGASRWQSSAGSGFGHVIMHDRNDTMWLGTRGEGLWRVRHDVKSRDVSIQRITVNEGLSSNIVRSVFEDRDGNVWVGTESGLHRFTASKAIPLTDIGFSWAVQSTPDGSIWIATSDGLVQFIGETRRTYKEEHGLPSPFVRALFTDVHGTLWVATNRGIARKVGSRFERVPTDDLSLPRMISLAADSHGALWLSDRELGAFVETDGHLKTVTTPSGISGTEANFVYVDRRDRAWMGFQGASVAMIEAGGQTQIHALGDAIGSVLTAVYEDRNGAIWIGGTRGLGRIADGAVDVVSQPSGLPGYGVFAITEDANGYIWLGVSSGIVRLSASDFEKAARQPRYRLTYRFYDASDGLVGVPARLGFPGAIRHADGTLWFITSRGASVVNPATMAPAAPPPPLRIENVRADDRPVRLVPGAALPPGTSRLLFEYTALNLTSPMKERFQYRLEGVDADWVDAGTRREAFYPNLRSGTYRFQVARLAGDQTADESTVAWEFSIRPMYYETWWFMWGCVGVAALIAGGAWQLRLRQLRRQFALVFAERARMSRELHDTLLQDLVGITLHFDEIAATLGTSFGPVTSQVVRLRRYLERSIGEARQAVWDLRSAHPDEGSLPRVLQESGERAFAGKPTRFEMTVTGTLRRCAPAIDSTLLRIAREALCNAARHAEATSVSLTLGYRTDAVVLQVSDNGRGCEATDYASELPGHYGFLIMKERSEQAGGRFHVDTSPGRGTRIEVTIPTSQVP